MHKLSLLLCLVFVTAATHPLLAGSLAGTSVTGALYFAGDTSPLDNFFSVDNGGSGTSATIGPGVEFTYSDSFNTDTADFNDTGLTITDVVAGNATNFSMVFTDAAFQGFTQVTNNSGFTYSFSGDTLTVNFAGTPTPGTYTTTFAPEPSTLFLLSAGALGLLGIMRRQRLRVSKV
jgi:hypothetical protein